MNQNPTDIFIVTYGRTGSTLLQALLNTAPGVEMEGENHGFLYFMFAGWKALKLSRQQVSGESRDTALHPFHGGSSAYRAEAERDLLALARNFLRRGGRSEAICGFKEVRHDVPDLEDYLAFLMRISERPHFIFLTRNHQDVMGSGFMRNIDPAILTSRLSALERDFARYAEGNAECCSAIRYEDIVAGTGVLQGLFAQLGLGYDGNRIAAVMSQQHSYDVQSALVFMGHRLQVATRKLLDQDFKLCRIDKPKIRQDDVIDLTGLVLPQDGLRLDALVAKPADALTSPPVATARLGISSPGVAQQFPQDPRASKARFSLTLRHSNRVQVIQAEVGGRTIDIATYYPPLQLPDSLLYPPSARTGEP